MPHRFALTSVGIVFTAVSLLCSLTFFLPFIIILPASGFLEVIFNAIYPNDYPSAGRASIATLCLIIAVIIFLFYQAINRLEKPSKQDLNFMAIKYYLILTLFIHALGSFIHTSYNWSSASDGQFIFGIANAFPVTSFGYLILGLVMDWLRSEDASHPAERHSDS
jgi:hypothetical protein